MTKVKKTVLFIGGGDYLKCFLKSFNFKKVFKSTHLLFIKKYDLDWSEIDKCDLSSLAAQKKVNLIDKTPTIKTNALIDLLTCLKD